MKTLLILPSIVSERKTYFHNHRKFFNSGVCSRLAMRSRYGYVAPFRDVPLVAPLKQLQSHYEWLGLGIRSEGKARLIPQHAVEGTATKSSNGSRCKLIYR